MNWTWEASSTHRYMYICITRCWNVGREEDSKKLHLPLGFGWPTSLFHLHRFQLSSWQLQTQQRILPSSIIKTDFGAKDGTAWYVSELLSIRFGAYPTLESIIDGIPHPELRDRMILLRGKSNEAVKLHNIADPIKRRPFWPCRCVAWFRQISDIARWWRSCS